MRHTVSRHLGIWLSTAAVPANRVAGVMNLLINHLTPSHETVSSMLLFYPRSPAGKPFWCQLFFFFFFLLPTLTSPFKDLEVLRALISLRWPAGSAQTPMATAFQTLLSVAFVNKPLFSRAALRHTVRQEAQHKADAQVRSRAGRARA